MVAWNKRKSARYLWCTLVVTTIVTCGAVLYFSFSTGSKQNSSSESLRDYSSTPEKLTEEKCISICDSKECVYQSKLLLDHLKPIANPCENFNEFACGKIFDKSDPEESRGLQTRFNNILWTKIKSMMDTVEADSESASGKMKIVYNSCMKYSSSDFQSIPTNLQFLRSLGIPGWPHLSNDFKFADPGLTRIIGNFLLYQEYGFIEFSTKYEYMELYEPNLQVNGTILYKNSTYESKENPERKYLVDRILNYFQLDPETIEEIWNESEAIREAIINLRKESIRIREEEEDWTRGFMDCTEDNEYDWEDLCESLKFLINTTKSNDEVNRNYARISGNEVYFMKNLFTVLGNFSDRSIANYLALNVFMNNLNELPFYFRLMRRKDDSDLYGNNVKSRWQNCVEWLSKHMAMALGHEYIKKDFTVLMLQEAQSLANEGIREAADLISRQEWMTDAVRIQVSQRMDDINVSFENFIETLPNETRVNEFYKQFHPTDANFLQNILEYKKCFRILEMHGIVTIVDTQWLELLFMANAGGGGDKIDINLGILFPPAYLPGLERSINLVSLGMIVLHELGHNLYSIFRYHLKSDAKARDYYGEKLKCLENQYSQFRFDSIGKNLNGSRYIGENFADTVAISIIDKLIEKLTFDNSSFLLPSLSFSVKQQLYISAVEMWCAVHSKKEEEYIYNLGTHSPDKFRLLGMMQNSKGFSEAFDCPSGSYMNPSTKCLLLE